MKLHQTMIFSRPY